MQLHIKIHERSGVSDAEMFDILLNRSQKLSKWRKGILPFSEVESEAIKAIASIIGKKQAATEFKKRGITDDSWLRDSMAEYAAVQVVDRGENLAKDILLNKKPIPADIWDAAVKQWIADSDDM